MDKKEVKGLVEELSDLIDSCENNYEAMVVNPDGTFELLLACHAMLNSLLNEVE